MLRVLLLIGFGLWLMTLFMYSKPQIVLPQPTPTPCASKWPTPVMPAYYPTPPPELFNCQWPAKQTAGPM